MGRTMPRLAQLATQRKWGVHMGSSTREELIQLLEPPQRARSRSRPRNQHACRLLSAQLFVLCSSPITSDRSNPASPAKPSRSPTWRRRRGTCTANPLLIRKRTTRTMLDATTQQELAVHQTVSVVLRALKRRVGVTERDVTRLTKARERTVRRWLEGSATPRAESAERIDELRALVVVLGDMLDPDGIVAWLRNRNPSLEYRRPLEVLATPDGFDEVLDAARELASGTFV